MIDVELRTPTYDSGSGETEWVAAAGLRVIGQEFDVRGEERLINFHIPVLNLRTGERLRWEENREDWARNLATAYHSPDLVVVVLEDDDPIPQAALEPAVTRHEVELPQPIAVW